MRKPDPTRFTGRGKHKPDTLEMKGFSAPVPIKPARGAGAESRSAAAPLPTPVTSEETPSAQQKRTDVPTDDRTSVRTNVRKEKRVKIRHAFDVFEDQLRELQLLQLEAVRASKRKPKLGEMVQEALDIFLKRQKGWKKK